MVFHAPQRSLDADLPAVGLFPETWGLFGITQSSELPKIIPNLRPLKVEIIFELWDDFGVLNKPLHF